MAKKTKRTQIEELTVAEQELSGQEMAQVQGGATNLNSSRTNAPLVASAGGIKSEPTNPGNPVPLLAAATTVKGSKSNSDN